MSSHERTLSASGNGRTLAQGIMDVINIGPKRRTLDGKRRRQEQTKDADIGAGTI